MGTINASLAHPCEIMKSAVLSNAASVMLIHNHPSGCIEPSADDIKLTNNMYSVCRLMEIPLRDHIIIGDYERYYSFAEHNVFEYRENAVDDVLGTSKVGEPSEADKADWMAARQQAIKEITEKLEQGVFHKYQIEKLPKVKELSQEFAQVLSEKREMHSGYSAAKKRMQELLKAQKNVETILEIKEEKPARQQEENSEKAAPDK